LTTMASWCRQWCSGMTQGNWHLLHMIAQSISGMLRQGSACRHLREMARVSPYVAALQCGDPHNFSGLLRLQASRIDHQSWKYSEFEVLCSIPPTFTITIKLGPYMHEWLFYCPCNIVFGVKFSLCCCRKSGVKCMLQEQSYEYLCTDDPVVYCKDGYGYNERNTLNLEYSHLQ
jgi:hypothetical protein